jgi:prepilin-type N-terminal cleavage/methylation domain-containing protein/prepilin-type processing-associated H-X9-DG protein
VNRDARAFTLLELLIVISVIVLLAALLLPILGGATGKARAVQCVSNLRQVGTALHGYLSNSSQRFPIVAWDPVYPGFQAWPTLLRRYLREDGVFLCPVRKRFAYDEAEMAQRGLTFPVNYGMCTAVQRRIYLTLAQTSRVGLIADATAEHFAPTETPDGLERVRACLDHSERAGVLFADWHGDLLKGEAITPALFTP